MATIYRGRCFCGAVRFEVIGEPLIQGYCHCEDCRNWSGTPVTAYSMWPPEKVAITEGSENLGNFSKTGNAIRKYCTKCGGSIMTDNTGIGLMDVYPVLLEGLSFSPTLHIRYGQRYVDMKDGLPKFKDLPEEAGGSGELLAE